MAKRPERGRVKTRLAEGARFGENEVVELAWAMLRCTATRLQARGHLVLAVTPDGSARVTAARLGIADATLLDQGPGGLGERMARVWLQVAEDRPVAFFGADSPDVPTESLDRIGLALDDADIACGPTLDGGYWTLAAGAYRPAVLDGIDWGSAGVYDQTRSRAVEAGLSFQPLPPWPDVDRPDDVEALRERLSGLGLSSPSSSSSSSCGPDAAPLGRLAERINELCTLTPPGEPR